MGSVKALSPHALILCHRSRKRQKDHTFHAAPVKVRRTMEGGISPDLTTTAIIAAVFLAAIVLLVYAIRRARKARARQIDEAGEDRAVPSGKAKKPALRAEDVVGEGELPSEATPAKPSVAAPTPAARQDRQESKTPAAEAVPAAKAKRDEARLPTPTVEKTPPAKPAIAAGEEASEEPAARQVVLPSEKPRAAAAPAIRPKARDAAALVPGLARTRAGWVSRLGQLFVGKKEIDPALFEEIEKVLLTADIGVRTSQKLLEEIRSSLGRRELTNPKAVWEFLRKRSIEFLNVEAPKIDYGRARPFVLLAIGVNGSGKTTTIGKLASKLKADGKSVLMAAGDTFRAAAAEQLEVWGARVGAPVIRGKEGGDPSSVIFDGIKRAMSDGVDVVIADTAGRLHTKSNLMEELQKVRRVVGKALDGAPHETWLVIDATSGQNAIAQAQIFTQAMSVTGIVLTKLDGTAKGGVILGIADQLRIPVRFIGVGERVEDLREFNAEEFVEALFEHIEEE
jgi:fused signal recognition particle receptor